MIIKKTIPDILLCQFALLTVIGGSLHSGGGAMKLIRCFLVTLVLGLMTGCMAAVKPGNIPEVGLDSVGPYSGPLSVDLINDQPDTTPHWFGSGGEINYPRYGTVRWDGSRHVAHVMPERINSGTSYTANYNEWTEFFIRHFSHELAKRGVTVSKDSPNKIKVKLSNFALFLGFTKVRVRLTVQLEAGDSSWSGTYEETDISAVSISGACGGAISHSIKKLLNDPEFIQLMKTGQLTDLNETASGD